MISLFFSSLFQRLKNEREQFLDTLFRELRFHVARHDLKRLVKKRTKILDFGCGPQAQFLQYLMSENFEFMEYLGVDPLFEFSGGKDPRAQFVKRLEKKREATFDLVVMFAVLEHLPYPSPLYGKIAAQVRPGGFLLLTTPSPLSQPVLEFLAFRLGIISRREIEEHTHYFTLQEVGEVFAPFGFVPVRAKTFEFGMNNYVVLQKEYRIKRIKGKRKKDHHASKKNY